MWASSWLGIPYRDLGRGPEYDCLGLWLAVQRVRFGHDLPDPGVTMLAAARARTAETMKPRFHRVHAAEEGDTLLFRVKGSLLHVGIALGGPDMLHTDPKTGSLIERWDALRWRSQLEGIYRCHA